MLRNTNGSPWRWAIPQTHPECNQGLLPGSQGPRINLPKGEGAFVHSLPSATEVRWQVPTTSSQPCEWVERRGHRPRWERMLRHDRGVEARSSPHNISPGDASRVCTLIREPDWGNYVWWVILWVDFFFSLPPVHTLVMSTTPFVWNVLSLMFPLWWQKQMWSPGSFYVLEMGCGPS